ncbi:hypothetical protein GBF38_017215 [Nibea albiflora]|uniref:Uncharacterized protein n=1 Tax=Nibea albiflora TaxID=240163 RepID=A0ACB7EEW2_NIBAL|nr:hypothetical protein GBF38_017215 [Nibea albiflora]
MLMRRGEERRGEERRGEERSGLTQHSQGIPCQSEHGLLAVRSVRDASLTDDAGPSDISPGVPAKSRDSLVLLRGGLNGQFTKELKARIAPVVAKECDCGYRSECYAIVFQQRAGTAWCYYEEV